MNKWMRFSSMGLQMGVAIFLGVWGGQQLDLMFPNEHQVYTIIFSLLGVFIALYQVIKEVKYLSEKEDDDTQS